MQVNFKVWCATGEKQGMGGESCRRPSAAHHESSVKASSLMLAESDARMVRFDHRGGVTTRHGRLPWAFALLVASSPGFLQAISKRFERASGCSPIACQSSPNSTTTSTCADDPEWHGCLTSDTQDLPNHRTMSAQRLFSIQGSPPKYGTLHGHARSLLEPLRPENVLSAVHFS